MKYHVLAEVYSFRNFKSRSRAVPGKRLKEGCERLRHLLNVFRCSLVEIDFAISNSNMNEKCQSILSVYGSLRTII